MSNEVMWGMGDELATPGDKLDLLDKAMKDLAEARAIRDEAESKYNIAAAAVTVIEDTLMGLLKSSNRESFKTPGVGSVSITHRQNFTTPKSGDEKVALFNYIKEKYGEETLRSMISINSMTLGSWAKKEIEEGVLSIPGLAQPTVTEKITFRRER